MKYSKIIKTSEVRKTHTQKFYLGRTWGKRPNYVPTKVEKTKTHTLYCLNFSSALSPSQAPASRSLFELSALPKQSLLIAESPFFATSADCGPCTRSTSVSTAIYIQQIHAQN